MSEMMEKEKSTENLSLIKEAQEGDRKAMEKLITQNMGLVKNALRKVYQKMDSYAIMSYHNRNRV